MATTSGRRGTPARSTGEPVDPGKPHPGVVLSVMREEVAGGMELEVVVQAKDARGCRGVGATLEVVDASPYPRRCASGDGCVDLLAR